MSGLAWPAHDVGPTPPPEYVSRARDDERTTRKKMAFWDRTKFLLLFFLLFLFFLANTLNQFEGIITLADGLRFALQESVWLLLLAGAEVIRQVHYLVSEHWSALPPVLDAQGLRRRQPPPGPHERLEPLPPGAGRQVAVHAGPARPGHRPDHGAAGVVGDPAGAGADPAGPAADLPARVRRLLPDLPVRHAVLVPVAGAASRPTSPTTSRPASPTCGARTTSSNKVKENMVFLEDPESIEERGRLRARRHPAVGSSRHRQDADGRGGRRRDRASRSCSSSPAPSSNMFMGVGILKVKSLFRKLRKLALRYGGVIVFFDEADALGNRRPERPRGWVAPAPRVGNGLPWEQLSACNGLRVPATTVRRALLRRAPSRRRS